MVLSLFAPGQGTWFVEHLTSTGPSRPSRLSEASLYPYYPIWKNLQPLFGMGVSTCRSRQAISVS